MKKIIELVKNKRIAFLENGDSLDDECSAVASLLSSHNIKFDCIFDIERLGLETVLRLCRNVDVLIFQTTWTYPVSIELKKAFMSIKMPEFKKIFIEVYIAEPTFTKIPEGVIHDIYILDGYKMLHGENYTFEKLS